jgi:hypothetical protein
MLVPLDTSRIFMYYWSRISSLLSQQTFPEMAS